VIDTSKLSKLPNIGAKLEEKLNEAGIDTFEQLKEIGSKQAFLNVRKNDSGACVSMLCALEGAIQGIRWHALSEEVKQELKKFHKSLKDEDII
jgi:DNA transformation protein